MKPPYHVWMDEFGTHYTLGEYATFAEAVEAYKAFYMTKMYDKNGRHYHDRILHVMNDNIADGGYGDDGSEWRNGLTEDEREELECCLEAPLYLPGSIAENELIARLAKEAQR